MGAAMATINSIRSNTDASLIFYIVTLEGAVALTRLVVIIIIKRFFLMSDYYVFVIKQDCELKQWSLVCHFVYIFVL